MSSRPHRYLKPKPITVDRVLNWTLATLLLAGVALVLAELVYLLPAAPAPIIPVHATLKCSPIEVEPASRQPGYAAEDVCEVTIPADMFNDESFWGGARVNRGGNPPPIPVTRKMDLLPQIQNNLEK